MRIQIVTSSDELRPLQGQWNELLSSSAANSVFLTWEWIATWLETVRPQAHLLTIVLRDARDELVAIAPFYITRMWLAGVVPYRVLRILGDQDSGAEYPDILVRAGAEERVLPVLARALRGVQHRWDCLWFPQVAEWTGARQRLARLAEAGVALRHNERPTDFAYVELPASHEAYLQSLSARLRARIRSSSARRVTHEAGDVELVRCQSNAQLADLLSALFDLHQRHWQALGQPGSFGPASRMRRFHERFAPLALRRGWLHLFALKLDGVIRAVQYGLAYAGDVCQVQEGYDPHAPAENALGVGNALRECVFRASIEEGLRTYDFLGEFTEHKRRWGARQRMGWDIFMGRPTLKNRALFTRPVWPTGRYLREQRWPIARPDVTVPAPLAVAGLCDQVEG